MSLRASVGSTLRNVRRGAVESAPVISAPGSPDPEDSLSRGRVRKLDASDPVVVAGPVGQAHSLAGMTVGTPGVGLDQAVEWAEKTVCAPVNSRPVRASARA